MQRKQDQIRSEITTRVIKAIKRGGLPPWRKAWTTDGNSGSPCNVVSTHRYKGINPLILELASQRHGFESKWFGTMKQWNALGGRIKCRPAHVPEGTWASQILFWSPIKKRKTDQNGDEKDDTFFVERTYYVFNIDQVEGVHLDHLRAGNAPLDKDVIDARFEDAEDAIRQIPATIQYGGDRAFYDIADDFIRLPHRHCFERPELFFETAGHELVHWSESRMKWDRAGEGYPMGELVAEIGACFWCSELGLGMGDFDQSCSYLAGWLRAMQNDPSFIFKAAAQASKSVDFLMSFSRQAVIESEPKAALVG